MGWITFWAVLFLMNLVGAINGSGLSIFCLGAVTVMLAYAIADEMDKREFWYDKIGE